ncbi:hypothetical protein ACJMK2_036299 [Sinanodonta woodiana]|uniref:DDE-1 domain-containing protein n=1 Tax=Sinanodonta woodiana TaxID=1069815 RepID=A0ABD3WKV3_SINWO
MHNHINLDVVKLARESHIKLLRLPQHSPHIVHPLDVGIMGPVKINLNCFALNLGFVN